jgi:hypothetical protein
VAAVTEYNKKELEYLHDQHFLITKNIIVDKTFTLLTTVQEELRQKVPSTLAKKSPKISRGEQYLGLPYMVLDYPRLFEQQDIFAFRTMFWWGNFFSSTLHLGGSYLHKYRQSLLANQDLLAKHQFYFCISFDPWQYHYQPDNYKLAKDCSDDELNQAFRERPFIKISRKWPITAYSKLPHLVIDTWEKIQSLLGEKE